MGEPNSQQQEALDELKDWIIGRKSGLKDVGLDDDLIDTRLVDSVGFVEYIMLIEEVGDCEIAVDAGVIEKVRTLRGVLNHFLVDI